MLQLTRAFTEKCTASMPSLPADDFVFLNGFNCRALRTQHCLVLSLIPQHHANETANAILFALCVTDTSLHLDTNTNTSTALLKPAVSFIGAMFCSNQALRYVSYPVQALAKSCKMVPVIAFQRLWFKKVRSFCCVVVAIPRQTFFSLPVTHRIVDAVQASSISNILH